LRVSRLIAAGEVVADGIREGLTRDPLPGVLKGRYAKQASEAGQGGRPGPGERTGELCEQAHAPDVPLKCEGGLSPVLVEQP